MKAKLVIIEINKKNPKIPIKWIHSVLFWYVKEVSVGDKFNVEDLISREDAVFDECFDPKMRDKPVRYNQNLFKGIVIKIVETNPKGKVEITKDTKFKVLNQK